MPTWVPMGLFPPALELKRHLCTMGKQLPVCSHSLTSQSQWGRNRSSPKHFFPLHWLPGLSGVLTLVGAWFILGVLHETSLKEPPCS